MEANPGIFSSRVYEARSSGSSARSFSFFSFAGGKFSARAETDMAYHSAGSPFEFEEARLNSRPLCSDGEAVLRQPFGVSEGH